MVYTLDQAELVGAQLETVVFGEARPRLLDPIMGCTDGLDWL